MPLPLPLLVVRIHVNVVAAVQLQPAGEVTLKLLVVTPATRLALAALSNGWQPLEKELARRAKKG